MTEQTDAPQRPNYVLNWWLTHRLVLALPVIAIAVVAVGRWL